MSDQPRPPEKEGYWINHNEEFGWHYVPNGCDGVMDIMRFDDITPINTDVDYSYFATVEIDENGIGQVTEKRDSND